MRNYNFRIWDRKFITLKRRILFIDTMVDLWKSLEEPLMEAKSLKKEIDKYLGTKDKKGHEGSGGRVFIIVHRTIIYQI